MKAWVYDTTKSHERGVYINLEEVPVPVPGPDDVLLRVDKVSVCGTDESLFFGKHPEVVNGTVPGHEFFGEIVEVGKNVQDCQPGHLVCGESHYTVEGYTEEGIIGFRGPKDTKGKYIKPVNGAYTEYVCMPQSCVRRIPQKVIQDGFWPSLFEGVGNDYKIGKVLQEHNLMGSVGIVGCGPHGLFTQIFARHFGVEKLIGFEVNHYRRGFARGMGTADAILNPADSDCDGQIREYTGGKLFDVVVDIAGQRKHVLDFCIQYTKPGGTVILFGLYDDPDITIGGHRPNDIIFTNSMITVPVEGKEIIFHGITGRDGIWDQLIQEVTNNRELQQKIMRPVSVMGSLEKLGDDTRNPHPEVLKRAYCGFQAEVCPGEKGG